MRTITRWLTVSFLAAAILPFLAQIHLPFGHTDLGIAYAKGGGGGGGGGGNGGHGSGGGGGGDRGGPAGSHAGSNSSRADTDRGIGIEAGRGRGQTGRGVGNAVSQAATSTAQAGKTAAQANGFRNLGQAVSSAVHKAKEGWMGMTARFRRGDQSPRRGGSGNAVSRAATSTAHAGKPAAQAAGFRNLGQAVSSAVHKAQQDQDSD